MNRFLKLVALVGVVLIGLSLAPASSGLTARAVAQEHAAAASGEHEEGNASPIAPPKQGMASGITALVCFGIVVFVLYIKVWPQITKGLDERASKIREEIAAAEAARKQAGEALEEYEKNLAQARAEANKMLEETKARQAELAAELRAKADVELGQMRERAMRDIEGAKKAALNEIYDQSVSLASAMASKILAREVTPQDQSRLFEESLAELQASRS
ncbi:MAG: F0F1 ATP synthase subunit B [Phycisphaerales bacterium]